MKFIDFPGDKLKTNGVENVKPFLFKSDETADEGERSDKGSECNLPIVTKKRGRPKKRPIGFELSDDQLDGKYAFLF